MQTPPLLTIMKTQLMPGGIPVVFGCVQQYNYDPEANTENGSCVPFVYGCTDPVALNFDEDANTDNGSCIEVVEGCADGSI